MVTPLGVGTIPNTGVVTPLRVGPIPNKGVVTPLGVGPIPNKGVVTPLRVGPIPNKGVVTPLRVGPIPNQGVVTPPQSGANPQQGSGYPPQGGANPQPGSGYPPQGGANPQPGSGYPPQGGANPQQGRGYPPQGGANPLQGGVQPPQWGVFPPGGTYPPQHGGYPPQPWNYPYPVGGFPSQVGTNPQMGPNPPPGWPRGQGPRRAPGGPPASGGVSGYGGTFLQRQDPPSHPHGPLQGAAQQPPRSQTLPRSITFNGTGNWRVFYGKFKAFADRARWSDMRRRDELYWCIDGAASAFMTMLLEKEQHLQVDEVAERLERRFGLNEHPESLQLELATARQGRDELHRDWAARILDMTTRAFPDYSEQQVQSQAVLYFCQGCCDREGAAYALNLCPKTVEAAMELVVWRKCAYRVVYSKMRKDVREATVAHHPDGEDRDVFQVEAARQAPQQARPGKNSRSPRPPAQVQPPLEKQGTGGDHEKKVHGDEMASMKGAVESQAKLTEAIAAQLAAQASQMEKMQKALDHLAQLVSQTRPRSRPVSPQPGTLRNLCYQCGKSGHFRRECPNPPAARAVTFMVDEEEELNSSGLEEEATPWPEQLLANPLE